MKSIIAIAVAFTILGSSTAAYAAKATTPKNTTPPRTTPPAPKSPC